MRLLVPLLAADAALGGGVDRQPLITDVRTAFDTYSKFTIVHALQRGLDVAQFEDVTVGERRKSDWLSSLPRSRIIGLSPNRRARVRLFPLDDRFRFHRTGGLP